MGVRFCSEWTCDRCGKQETNDRSGYSPSDPPKGWSPLDRTRPVNEPLVLCPDCWDALGYIYAEHRRRENAELDTFWGRTQ